jgi:hypothetical protein
MNPDWAGDWDTDYGDMELEVNGSSLTGTYDSRGGTIQGTVCGNKATGIWRQHYSDKPRLNWGRFCLVMDDDGDFEGDWCYGDDIGPPWDGTWEGEKDE